MPHRPLEAGDVILSEVTGKYAGYWSQAHVPVAVGGPPDYPVICENMILTLEPIAMDDDARIGVHLAETFAVTGAGCRRLGRRDLVRIAT